MPDENITATLAVAAELPVAVVVTPPAASHAVLDALKTKAVQDARAAIAYVKGIEQEINTHFNEFEASIAAKPEADVVKWSARAVGIMTIVVIALVIALVSRH